MHKVFPLKVLLDVLYSLLSNNVRATHFAHLATPQEYDVNSVGHILTQTLAFLDAIHDILINPTIVTIKIKTPIKLRHHAI